MPLNPSPTDTEIQVEDKGAHDMSKMRLACAPESTATRRSMYSFCHSVGTVSRRTRAGQRRYVLSCRSRPSRQQPIAPWRLTVTSPIRGLASSGMGTHVEAATEARTTIGANLEKDMRCRLTGCA